MKLLPTEPDSEHKDSSKILKSRMPNIKVFSGNSHKVSESVVIINMYKIFKYNLNNIQY